MRLFYKSIITRDDGKPYLIRYCLIETKWLKICIHKILISDDACLHDHPWNFISFIFKGEYLEYKCDNPKIMKDFSAFRLHYYDMKWIPKSKVHTAPALLYRRARVAHRLEIIEPVWTFVIMFRRVREWGFWTKTGWLPWNIYNEKANRCD
jgi:hypothetical protein